MLKPENVPEEAVNGLRKAMFKNGTAREYIAAALNAWPNAFEYRSAHANYGQCLSLPLLTEASDE